MAIELGAIVERTPPVGRERTHPIEITKDMAGLVIQDKIEEVVDYGRKPFKLFRHYGGAGNSLFTLAEDYGYIFMGSEHPGFNVAQSDLQEVGLMVMEKFGFNPDLFEVESLSRHENGTASERRIYRSRTVNKLEFKRWFDYVQGTNSPISVDWSVHWKLH